MTAYGDATRFRIRCYANDTICIIWRISLVRQRLVAQVTKAIFLSVYFSRISVNLKRNLGIPVRETVRE